MAETQIGANVEFRDMLEEHKNGPRLDQERVWRRAGKFFTPNARNSLKNLDSKK
jgi:hypothetical protein